jgi:hypothetical protein
MENGKGAEGGCVRLEEKQRQRQRQRDRKNGETRISRTSVKNNTSLSPPPSISLFPIYLVQSIECTSFHPRHGQIPTLHPHQLPPLRLHTNRYRSDPCKKEQKKEQKEQKEEKEEKE